MPDRTSVRARSLVDRFYTGRLYTGRLYTAWSNRCPRCLLQPFHGDSNAPERTDRPQEVNDGC